MKKGIFVLVGFGLFTVLLFFSVLFWSLDMKYSTQEHNEKQNHILLFGDSKSMDVPPTYFGNEEYECLGTCYCQNYERRASIPLISRTISFLVFSMSSVVAYDKAKSFFENECRERLSSDCHLSAVKSSVDECSPSIKEETSEDTSKEQKIGERRTYFCFGNCVKNRMIRRKDSMEQFQNMDCGKFRKEGEVTIFESELIIHSDNVPSGRKFHHTARAQFQLHQLTKFCKEKSELKYVVKETTSRTYKNGKPYQYDRKTKGFGCVGRSNMQKGKSNNFGNVRCRQIDPKPTSGNTQYWNERFWGLKRDWDDGRVTL